MWAKPFTQGVCGGRPVEYDDFWLAGCDDPEGRPALVDSTQSGEDKGMLVSAEGCDLDLDRGPNWLFVRLRNFDPEQPEAFRLAEQIWQLLEKHLVYRVVLELDEIDILRTLLIAQLVMLHRKVCDHDGVVHLSGVSKQNREVLRRCRLDGRLPAFGDRVSAVKGAGPHWPR